MDPDRQLMIKVKTCQRLRKEVDFYLQEVKDNEQQLQEMKNQNKDPYDIKKFDEVVGESRMMVPDSQRRLAAAILDLQQFMNTLATASSSSTSSSSSQGEEGVVPGGQWKEAALELLKKEGQAPEQADCAMNTPPPSSSTTTAQSNTKNEAFTTPTTDVDNLGEWEVF